MKTTLQVMYWRDIPAQVKAQAGRQRASRPLSARFQEAIDAAAMISGATDSDAYLNDWRAGDPQESDLELEAAA
ncbi:MAG: virulence factor, partial [Chloroflexi bacterium]|nr:virulence factor [Chloroflexota bacterium]